MKKVLITGATGLVGQEIVAMCHKHDIAVNFLTSSKKKLKNASNYKGFYWDLSTKEIDSSCFENVDTIINLVGAPIAKKWTSSYKKEIISSRIDSAHLIFETLKTIDHNVTQIITASAIGYYPNSLTNFYKESFSEVNSNFLGDVVRKWEDAIDVFSSADIAVSYTHLTLPTKA